MKYIPYLCIVKKNNNKNNKDMEVKHRVSEEKAAYDYVERMLCTETTQWRDYRSMLSTFMKRLDRRYGGSLSDEEYTKVTKEWAAIVSQIVTEAKKRYNVQEITNKIPSIDDILAKLFIGHNIIKK